VKKVKIANVAEKSVTMTQPENLVTTIRSILQKNLKQLMHLYFAEILNVDDQVDVAMATELEDQEMTTALSPHVTGMPPMNQRT